MAASQRAGAALIPDISFVRIRLQKFALESTWARRTCISTTVSGSDPLSGAHTAWKALIYHAYTPRHDPRRRVTSGDVVSACASRDASIHQWSRVATGQAGHWSSLGEPRARPPRALALHLQTDERGGIWRWGGVLHHELGVCSHTQASAQAHTHTHTHMRGCRREWTGRSRAHTHRPPPPPPPPPPTTTTTAAAHSLRVTYTGLLSKYLSTLPFRSPLPVPSVISRGRLGR